MPPLADLIRYYRDCFRADRRSGALLDLFARKIEHLHFLASSEGDGRRRDEVLSGLNPLPVSKAKLGDLAAAAKLYALEETVVFGAFVLVARPAAQGDNDGSDSGAGPPLAGRVFGRSPNRILAAPLWLFPARLTDDPDYPPDSMPLSVDLDSQRPNTELLASVLGSDDAGVQAAEGLAEALGIIDDGSWPADAGRRLADALSSLLPELSTDDAIRFPQLSDRKAIESAIRGVRRNGRPRLLSAQCIALVPRSYETRGILHELTAIADGGETSPPLDALLHRPSDLRTSDERSAKTGTKRTGSSSIEGVPAILSRAQHQALVSARSSPLTLVIGPPGTGKTFTLAALALDHVRRGESVLVAAQSQESLDVLGAKIADIAGSRDMLLEGGRGRRMKGLKDRLRHLLGGGEERSLETARPVRKLDRRIAQLQRGLATAEVAIRRQTAMELDWGLAESRTRSGDRIGIAAKVSQSFRGWRLTRRPPFWYLTQEYLDRLQERVACDAERLKVSIRQRRHSVLSQDRATISQLDAALRAPQSAVQTRRFAKLDLAVVLRAFPIWSTRFSDVHRLLPRRSELFDLVIIDEATQCDLASALPALLRARRAVVTGDAKQLRHLSFLSIRHQAAVAERHGLRDGDVWSYRDTSLLDLASESIRDHGQAVTLDEHFRSTPQIIEFSNREFYRGQLRVMSRRPETLALHSLRVERIAGKRLESGANPVEATALVEALLAQIETEAGLPARRASSIGVLSPFRDQADCLAEQLLEALPPGSVDRHEIRVGTPYAFQGDERDIMLLSLALDDDSAAGAFRYLDRPDVFNVAITRARNRQVIFCSFDPTTVRSSLVGRYLDHALSPRPVVSAGPGDDGADAFLQEVDGAVSALGAQTWPRFAVAGIEIDLLISDNGGTVGLDLVGYPGPLAGLFDLERYRILQRSGLRVLPIPFSTWTRNRDLCLQAIRGALGG